MSGVNVPWVLRAIQLAVDGTDSNHQARELYAAGEAVAELIGAVDSFVNYDAMAEGDVSLLDSPKHWDALSAALARCKPAALSQPATQQGE